MGGVAAGIEGRHERIEHQRRDEEPADDPRHDRHADAGDRRQQEQECPVRTHEVAIADGASAAQPRVRCPDAEEERLRQAAAEHEPLPHRAAARRGEEDQDREGGRKEIRHDAGVAADEHVAQVVREVRPEDAPVEDDLRERFVALFRRPDVEPGRRSLERKLVVRTCCDPGRPDSSTHPRSPC